MYKTVRPELAGRLNMNLDELQNAYEAVLDDWTAGAEADGQIRLYSASPEMVDERLGIGIGVRNPADGAKSIGIQIRCRRFADLSDERRLVRLQGAVDRAEKQVLALGLPAHVIDVISARFPLISRIRRGHGGIFNQFRTRCRPLEIGASIGRADGMTGTLGCFVKYQTSGPNSTVDRGLLSCSHILARSYESSADRRGKEGDAVYQPREPRTNPVATQEVGNLTQRFSILSPDANNFHDVAVAKLTTEDRSKYSNILAPGVRECYVSGSRLLPPGDGTVEPLMSVGKLGRSTGFTEGVVTGIRVTQRISSQFGGTFPFADMIEIAAKPDGQELVFSDSGDSGAVVFTLPDCRAIGVLVAGGENEAGEHRTYACDLRAALDDLEIELV
jgi:hypothetical protein